MSQVYDKDGNIIPVTVIEAELNTIVQIKTKEKDKYEAVQVGYGTKKPKNIAKQQKGHFKKLDNFAVLKEFRLDSKVQSAKRKASEKSETTSDSRLATGQKIDVSVFSEGDVVRVMGITKGKGFQGVMKRHGFHGMPHSHGHHHVARHGGSIGQRFPQHTLRGMKMPGRMGHNKLTVRGLKVVTIDPENNLIAIKGAVPGNKGGLVMIQSQ